MESDADTLRKRILSTIENGGKNQKNFQWMSTHLLADLSLKPSDLRNILKNLWNEGIVGHNYGNYWIKKTYTNGTAQTQWEVTDYFCRALLTPENKENFDRVKERFSKADGEAFKLLAAIILDEPLPKFKILEPDDWTEEVQSRWGGMRNALNL